MKFWLLFLAALWLCAAQSPAAALGQPRERCFDATGACLSDPLLGYWQRHGGLSAFGYPLGPAHLETVEGRTLKVQWFERDRLELQLDGTVTAGRLGARWLELQGRPWQAFPSVGSPDPGCAYFAATSHQLCEPFLGYWKARGGLALFGYPISERMAEDVEGRPYEVQYFERRRMELHPELAGARDKILLGLLGSALAQSDSCIALDQRFEPVAYAYRGILGCPRAASRELVGNDRLGLRDVPMATQRFEHGTMLWVRQFAGDALASPGIFVLTPAPDRQALIWQQFADVWGEGQPTGVVGTPPEGLYAPARGFGYLWATHADVRAQLGWAIEPEAGDTGGYRQFSKGFMLYRPAADRLFLVTEDGMARDVPRQ